jgi:hypothetical protein
MSSDIEREEQVEFSIAGGEVMRKVLAIEQQQFDELGFNWVIAVAFGK